MYDPVALRRAEFPWADERIYLNHASIGPLPERSRLVLERYNRLRAAPHRLVSADLDGVFEQSRRLAARLINAAPREIALTTNTSYGLHLAAQMLPLGPGDIILVSEGEFPANVYPWKNLERRGVAVEMVPLDAAGWPDEDRLVDRMHDSKVRALTISQVQFHTGYQADLHRLSAAARATDTFLVVDAIQALGQLPLDLEATPVDLLSCGAQKWLLSPWGSGFLYVRDELIERLESPLPGWTAFAGTDDYSHLLDYRSTLRSDARRFELITLPFQDFAGMVPSLELLLELDPAAIAAHLRTLIGPVVDWARERGVPVASPTGRAGTGIVSLKPAHPEAVFQALSQAGVVASLREGLVRLSPHCYNTAAEMRRVVEVLDRAVRELGPVPVNSNR